MTKGAALLAEGKMHIYIEEPVPWESITGKEFIFGGRRILCNWWVMN